MSVWPYSVSASTRGRSKRFNSATDRMRRPSAPTAYSYNSFSDSVFLGRGNAIASNTLPRGARHGEESLPTITLQLFTLLRGDNGNFRPSICVDNNRPKEGNYAYHRCGKNGR